MSRQKQIEYQRRPNRGRQRAGRSTFPRQGGPSRREFNVSLDSKPYERPNKESTPDRKRRFATQQAVIESPFRQMMGSEADFERMYSSYRIFKPIHDGELENKPRPASSSTDRFMQPCELEATATDFLQRSNITSTFIHPSRQMAVSESTHRRRSSTPSIGMQLSPRQIATSANASPIVTGVTRSMFVKPVNHEMVTAGSAAQAIPASASDVQESRPETLQELAKPIQTCCQLKEEITRRIQMKRENGATAEQIAYALFHLEYESSPYADYGKSRPGHPYLTSDEAMRATIHIETHNALNKIKEAHSAKVMDESICQDLDKAAETSLAYLGKNLKKIYHDHSLITNAALRMEVNTLMEKNTEISKTNTELSSKIQELKNDESADTKTRCRTLLSAWNELRNDYLALQKEHKKLRQSHEQFQNECERLKVDAESMQKVYEQLVNDSRKSQLMMKKDVEALEKQLAIYEPHMRFD